MKIRVGVFFYKTLLGQHYISEKFISKSYNLLRGSNELLHVNSEFSDRFGWNSVSQISTELCCVPLDLRENSCIPWENK